MNVLREHKNERIHFIGIGGTSMSGLAMILKNLGYQVSGSDSRESDFTAMLQKNNVSVSIGQEASNVEGAGLVVYSAAIKPWNPEFARAKELGIPMLERSVALGMISANYETVIGIAGCHGKTTITSMLAYIMLETSFDPTIHVGGMVDFLGGGVKLGTGKSFITEACEYVRSFLTLHPTYVVINNIDDDHLDCYKDLDEIVATFSEFVALMPENGILFANPDDEYTKTVIKDCKQKVITYSIHGNGDFNAENVAYDEMGSPSFDVVAYGKLLGRVQLNVPGLHNVQNALAAIAVAMTVYQMEFSACAERLSGYHLVGRRFELKGEYNGVKIFHDYAHHPAEIQACLSGAKRYPHKKLLVLFQCNSFTRARTLKDKYAVSFEDADLVMVPDLYPGRDIDTGDIHATDLVKVIDAHSHNCIYLPTFEEIKEHVRKIAQPGDIIVTIGSGDVGAKTKMLLED